MSTGTTRTRASYLVLTVFFTLFCDISVAEITSHEEAEKQLEEYTVKLSNSPDNALLYALRGDIYFLIHDFNNAVEDYSSAIELDNTLDRAYYGRGLAYARQGFIKDGIQDLSHFIKKNPDSSLAYTKRGVRYLWLGEKDNAYKDLKKAISLNPNNAEAHDDLGVVLAQMNNYIEAIKHFRLTISIEPLYQKAYHNLAMAYYITENDAIALQTINKSIQLKSGEKNSLLLKSKILMALGRTEDAKKIENDALFLPAGDWSELVPVQ